MATIIVIGNVTADLELKTAEGGSAYVTFSIAENTYNKEAGQQTTYYQCIVYGNMAERLVNAKVKKGSCLQVIGRHELSVYEKKDKSIGHALKISVTDWMYTPTGRKTEENPNSEAKKPTNQDFSEVNETEIDDDLPF